MRVKINVPDSLKDITVGQYQEWTNMIDGSDWSPTREKIITVAIFCNEDIDKIESITVKGLNKVYSELVKMLNGAFDNELKKVIELEGVEYGFHPNIDQMTTGEWADLEEELSETGNLWGAMPNILSVLYRPITKKKKNSYQIEDYDVKHMNNAEIMKQVDMETASGMAVFFWSLGAEYTKNFIQSTKNTKPQTVET